MADRPEIEALAKRFLDLWERQAALVSDPEWAAAMARALDLGGRGAAGPRRLNEREERLDSGHGGERKGKSARAAGTAAARASSELGARDLAELARRVAACEERISRLEARSRKGGGRPRGKPRGGGA